MNISFLSAKRPLLSLLAGGAALVALAVSTATASAQSMQDCSANSIVKCGASSPSDLVAKVKANSPSDLSSIYGHFALTADKYTAFAGQAKTGTAYKDGRIVVDGQVVATKAWSIGRDSKSYSAGYKIGSATYYKSNTTDVFENTSMPVFVLFNDKGVVDVAILQPCGNPMGGEQVIPKYECRGLNMSHTTGDTYQFSTNAPVSNNAVISKVVYDFGDGSATVTKTKATDLVTHTYTKAGDFTPKVDVYVKVPGGQEIKVDGSSCTRSVTVKEQPKPTTPAETPKKSATWKCSNLQATQKSQSDNAYVYTLRASAAMTNASLSQADFNFGDGVTQQGLQPAGTDSNTVAVDHTYGQAGTYTATATLYFKPYDNANAGVAANTAACQVTFTITKPAQTVAYTQPAKTLPSTGIEGSAGLFGGASVLGTLGYRWRARRRLTKIDDLLDKIKG